MNTLIKRSKRFTHDCDACLYLGTALFEGVAYDYYFCRGCDGGSIIARYDSAGHKYTSAPWQVCEEIVMRNRAQGKDSVYAVALPAIEGLITRSVYQRYKTLELRLELAGASTHWSNPDPKLVWVRERLWQINNYYS